MAGMTDWAALVSKLFAVLGRAELARLTGAGVTTLADLATGTTGEPRHALGTQLLALYAQHVMGKEAA